MKDIKTTLINSNINKPIKVDESLGDLLKKFWSWLTGADNKAEYIYGGSDFNASKKKSFINQHNAEAIVNMKEIPFAKVQEIAKQSGSKNGDKEGLWKTYHFIQNPDKTQKMLFNAWLFKTKDLTEVCAVMAFKPDTSTLYIKMFDLDKMYASVWDWEDFVTYIKEIAEKKSCTSIDFSAEKSYVSKLNEAGAKFDKKGYWALY